MIAIRKIFICTGLILFLMPLFAANVASADCIDDCQLLPDSQIGDCVLDCPNNGGGNNPGTNPAGGNSPKLLNPLGTITTLDGFVRVVLDIFIAIAWAVAAFFLLLSGFRFVQAQGKPEKLEEAKKTFYNTIIGIVLIAGANVIIKVLQELLQEVAR